MPELTDEHIEDLFADLRADEIRQVRPPGIAAARSTVKRRRTVQSVAAGVAVLAVAGGIAAVGLNTRNPPSGITDTHADSPLLPTDEVPNPGHFDGELDVLAAQAKHVVTQATPGGAVQLSMGLSIGVVDTLTSAEAPYGAQVIRIACQGSSRLGSRRDGQLHVVVRNQSDAGPDDTSTGDELATRTITCSGAPKVITIPFSYSKGTLAVTIDPDRDALGRSGVAYSLTSGVAR